MEHGQPKPKIAKRGAAPEPQLKLGLPPSFLKLVLSTTEHSRFPTMQSVQRRFGRTTQKRADDSQVAALLKDFEDADMLLSRVGAHVLIAARP